MNKYIIAISFFVVTNLNAQVDSRATAATKKLYNFLNNISLSFNRNQKILIGQQNAFSEGRGWRIDNNNVTEDLRSDMYDAVGVHPAVFGLDFLEIGSWNRDAIIKKIRQVHDKGGVITLSWHPKSFVDDGIGDGSYSDRSTPVVTHILPGGKAHRDFLEKLRELAQFLTDIGDVPVVFRPWHEHNFSWFWWGADHCTKEEYIALWRFTANYFKRNGIHNLLYAYSPAHINNDFFDRYPGDDYVDIFGPDFYFRNANSDQSRLGPNSLTEWRYRVVWLLKEADRRNKIPVLSEFGQEGMKYDRFWTNYVGLPLERRGISEITRRGDMPNRGVAWVLLWRNDKTSPTHFFAPFPGHSSNPNFIELLKNGVFKGL